MSARRARPPTRPGVAAALLLAALALPAGAEVYEWTDEKGVTHFSDCPPRGCSPEVRELDPRGPSREEVLDARERQQALERYLRRLEDERSGRDRERGRSSRSQDAREIGSAWPVTPPRDECASTAGDWLGVPAAALGEPLAPVPLGAETRESLGHLLHALPGRWHGSVEETVCVGGAGELRSRRSRHDAELEAVFGTDGRLDLNIQVDRSDSDRRDLELLWLYLGDRFLHAGDVDRSSFAEPRWAVELAPSPASAAERPPSAAPAHGSDRVLFERRFRRRQATTSTWHVELRALELEGSRLALDELFFVQGRLAERRLWRLER